MNINISVTQKELFELLLNIGLVRPVFIWGPPGIGKSALVEKFAEELSMECVSLLGSQLAPEDIIGVPQIVNGVSKFCPPKNIVREEPFVLFLDELNACSQEVQKAFYSLIHDKRIGEYILPKGSIVIGAGNRAEDSAIVKTMSSALINRMIHVELKVSHKDWLHWAYEENIHEYVIDYIKLRPDHLHVKPSKVEEPFSSPRSWHMLSDGLKEYNGTLSNNVIEILAKGCLTNSHAINFKAFCKQLDNKYLLEHIISGKERWPDKPEDRDLLYFLSQAFRSYIIKNVPKEKSQLKDKHLIQNIKLQMRNLAEINLEMTQIILGEEEDFPNWFVVEVVKDLPRIVRRK